MTVTEELQRENNRLLGVLLAETRELRKSAEIGTKTLASNSFSLLNGVAQIIVPTDKEGRARRVLVVVEPGTDLADVVLAISPQSTVAVEVGPLFASGTSHDLGIIPADTELWAVQKPATLATARVLRLWAMVAK